MTQVTLIPGDGIGPSIIESARRIIEASGAPIKWIEAQAGESSFHAGGNPLPDATVASIAETRVALRQEFDLYANVRPAIAYEGVKCLYPGLNLVVIRENTEGLYSNMEHWIGDKEAAIGIGVNTRSSMERMRPG